MWFWVTLNVFFFREENNNKSKIFFLANKRSSFILKFNTENLYQIWAINYEMYVFKVSLYVVFIAVISCKFWVYATRKHKHTSTNNTYPEKLQKWPLMFKTHRKIPSGKLQKCLICESKRYYTLAKSSLDKCASCFACCFQRHLKHYWMPQFYCGKCLFK